MILACRETQSQHKQAVEETKILREHNWSLNMQLANVMSKNASALTAASSPAASKVRAEQEADIIQNLREELRAQEQEVAEARRLKLYVRCEGKPTSLLQSGRLDICPPVLSAAAVQYDVNEMETIYLDHLDPPVWHCKSFAWIAHRVWQAFIYGQHDGMSVPAANSFNVLHCRACM